MGQTTAAVGLFKAILDSAEVAPANAPFSEEPPTAEVIEGLNAPHDWLKHSKPISHEQMLAEPSITHNEINRY